MDVNQTGAGFHRDSRREAREGRGASERRAIEESVADALCECGKVEGTFACKIRHINLNSGVAKAAND